MAPTLIEKRFAKILADERRAETDFKRAETKLKKIRKRVAYYRSHYAYLESELPHVKLPKRTTGERTRAMDPAFRKAETCRYCGKGLYVLDKTPPAFEHLTAVHSTAKKDEACQYLRTITQGAKP